MLFHTLEFGVFFIVVYGLYLILPWRRQNRLLLVASYVFYGSWDWRFLSLIIFSTVLDYFCGLKIHGAREERTRKKFLTFSIVGNLLVLGFFKYFNFFIENLQALFSGIGLPFQTSTLNIILPLGISFYTFQTLSYTIDVYRKEMEPTRCFWDFGLFVAFFPQLIAGPIERAKHLLPQILRARALSPQQFGEGVYLFFWGLFQKIFIADNLAQIVDPIFAASPPYTAVEVLLGVYAFTFQIFCDFAGYSNMARGLGKVMGFDIMINFRLPFFTTNVQDFWTQWHISLSSWIRDYLYLPLFGSLRSLKGNLRVYVSLVISMAVIGLWHGAAWNFVLFGLYYGVLLVVYVAGRGHWQKWVSPGSRFGQRVWFIFGVVMCFQITALGMLLFRVESLGQIGSMLKALAGPWSMTERLIEDVIKYTAVTALLLLIQIAQYTCGDLLVVRRQPLVVRPFIYALMTYLIVTWGVMSAEEYVYFQF